MTSIITGASNSSNPYGTVTLGQYTSTGTTTSFSWPPAENLEQKSEAKRLEKKLRFEIAHQILADCGNARSGLGCFPNRAECTHREDAALVLGISPDDVVDYIYTQVTGVTGATGSMGTMGTAVTYGSHAATI